MAPNTPNFITGIYHGLLGPLDQTQVYLLTACIVQAANTAGSFILLLFGYNSKAHSPLSLMPNIYYAAPNGKTSACSYFLPLKLFSYCKLANLELYEVHKIHGKNGMF